MRMMRYRMCVLGAIGLTTNPDTLFLDTYTQIHAHSYEEIQLYVFSSDIFDTTFSSSFFLFFFMFQAVQ